MSIKGSMDPLPGGRAETSLAPFFGIAIWCLLLWKIWKRPRAWGFGVGIFLFLMIAFQSFLWWRGINNPELDALNLDRSVANFILLYELPIFIAGVSCILLRFNSPNESSDSAA